MIRFNPKLFPVWLGVKILMFEINLREKGQFVVHLKLFVSLFNFLEAYFTKIFLNMELQQQEKKKKGLYLCRVELMDVKSSLIIAALAVFLKLSHVCF